MVLKCPDLGPGSGHQILKVGDAEQTQEEAFFFGKIARDFSYVTRPAAQGRVTIELQGHEETPFSSLTRLHVSPWKWAPPSDDSGHSRRSNYIRVLIYP